MAPGSIVIIDESFRRAARLSDPRQLCTWSIAQSKDIYIILIVYYIIIIILLLYYYYIVLNLGLSIIYRIFMLIHYRNLFIRTRAQDT